MNHREMKLSLNSVDGLDLLVGDDVGTLIRIRTGSWNESLNFWTQLQKVCNEALSEFDYDQEN